VVACAGGTAAAADVGALGYGALLPGGTQGAVSVGGGAGEDTASTGALRPSGGGTIAGISTTVATADGGRDGSARGTVVARGLTLFEGRVSIGAIRMGARVDAGPGGRTVSVESASVEGLVVNGAAVSAGAGSRVPVAGIGTLVFFERSDTATGVSLNGMRVEVTDPEARKVIGEPFVVGHLELEATPGPEPTASTAPATTAPATTAPGTTTPQKAAPATTRSRTTTAPRATTTAPGRPAPAPAPARTSPLTTPEPTPLSPLPRKEAPAVALAPGDGYVFPAFGDVGYSDDFLAPRAGTGQHYGNDIFGPTGTPILAVADGRLSKVGVNTLGGNRLWLTDDAGNWFYYAHLSAYAPVAVEGARVTRGQVIAFMGNTGQAITTPPHLHFEIHPGGMDATALNPYPYLLAWERGAGEVPKAFHGGGDSADPSAPVGAVVVDAIPEVDSPPGPGEGIAIPVR